MEVEQIEIKLLEQFLNLKSSQNDNYNVLIDETNEFNRTLSLNPIINRILLIINYKKIVIGTLYPDEKTLIIMKYNIGITINEILTFYTITDNELYLKMLDASLQSLKDILDINPFHKETITSIYNNYNKITSLNDKELNVKYFEDALNYIPENPSVHLLLGFFYNNINNSVKSLYHYKLCIALNKENNLVIYLNAYSNIFMLYYNQDKYKICIKFLLKGLDISKDDPELNEKLGVSYMKLEKFKPAGIAFEKAIVNINKSILSTNKDLTLAGIYSNYAFYNDRIYDYDKGSEFYKKSSVLNPKGLIPYQCNMMNLNYERFSFKNRFYPGNEHRKINDFFEKTASYIFDANYFKTPRINIGFVSGDFKVSHAVYFFLDTFLNEHNKNIFNVICYSENVPNVPNIQYKSTIKKNAKEVSNMIHEDKIHILIDLSGHTSLNRLDVFKNKPSPIQISYIGYPFTNGINEMDYRITDQICEYDTTISQVYYTEKLLCLDNCFLCYKPPSIPDIVELEYSNGEDEIFNIGCYGRPNKMAPDIILLFIRILRDIKNIKLFFNSPQFTKDDLLEKFLLKFPKELHDKIDFIKSKGSITDHMSSLNQIHIQIDTAPYSSTTTACESFLMGVPMLTVYDTETCYHCTNVTTSLLKNSDLDYYVCSDQDELFDKLIELKNKPKEFWLTLKTETRQKFLSGKVCNRFLYLENITKLFLNLYDKHKIKPLDPEILYQEFLNKEWNVNWEMIPLRNEELELVIIEPRKHKNLSRVISNFCSQLNNYSITWYCSEDNKTWLDDQLPTEALNKIKKVIFTQENITIYQYNDLLTSSSFWNSFNSKKVLIFQTDAGLLRNNVEDFLSYDYTGAGYPKGHAQFNHNKQELVCGNGGFSLRNPKLMGKICDNPNPLYNKFPEDFFFSNHLTDMSRVNKKIIFPKTPEEANKFSSELIIDNDCFGFHSVYKYHDYDEIKVLFKL